MNDLIKWLTHWCQPVTDVIRHAYYTWAHSEIDPMNPDLYKILNNLNEINDRRMS